MINLLSFSKICYHEFSVAIQVHKCILVILITSRITITYCMTTIV